MMLVLWCSTKCSLQWWHSIRVLVWVLAISLPVQLLANTSGKQQNWPKCLGPCHHDRRPGWSSKILVSAQPSPGHWGHLENEPPASRLLSLFLSLWLSLSFCHTLSNKSTFIKRNADESEFKAPLKFLRENKIKIFPPTDSEEPTLMACCLFALRQLQGGRSWLCLGRNNAAYGKFIVKKIFTRSPKGYKNNYADYEQ